MGFPSNLVFSWSCHLQTHNFTHCFPHTSFIMLFSYWIALKFLREFSWNYRNFVWVHWFFYQRLVCFSSRYFNVAKFRDTTLLRDWTYFNSFIHKELEISVHKGAKRSVKGIRSSFSLKCKVLQGQARGHCHSPQAGWDFCLAWIPWWMMMGSEGFHSGLTLQRGHGDGSCKG